MSTPSNIDINTEALTRRVRELEAETWRLNAIIASRDTTPSVLRPSTPRSSKSYLQPTAAFRSKTTMAIQDSTETKASRPVLRDEAGRLIVDHSVSTAHFARPTFASGTDRYQEYSPLGDDGWNMTDGWDTKKHFNEPEYVTRETGEEGTARDLRNLPPEVKELALKSRLYDTTFYADNPVAKVHLPFKTQQRLLNKVYRHAQISLWLALGKCHPDSQKRYYAQGPSTISFGRGELAACFGKPFNPTWQNEIFGNNCTTVIINMADLRNAMCHSSSVELKGHGTVNKHAQEMTKGLDDLIQYAQSLAVWMMDEPRAMAIRKIRNEMQKLGTQEYQAIEARERSVTAVKEWAYHHQILFRSLFWNLGNSPTESADFGPTLLRAVKGWKLEYGDVGVKR